LTQETSLQSDDVTSRHSIQSVSKLVVFCTVSDILRQFIQDTLVIVLYCLLSQSALCICLLYFFHITLKSSWRSQKVESLTKDP